MRPSRPVPAPRPFALRGAATSRTLAKSADPDFAPVSLPGLSAIALASLLALATPEPVWAAQGSCGVGAGGLTVDDVRSGQCDLEAGDALVVNGAGEIRDGNNGVFVDSGETGISVTNAGLIRGASFDGVFNQGSVSAITNSGRIDGVATGIYNPGQIGTITNNASGTIAGNGGSGGDAIISNLGGSRLTTLNNRGLIDGRVTTQDTTINIYGSSARFTGAVVNTLVGNVGTGDASINVRSGASFTTENTFRSDTFVVHSGGTLRMNSNAHTIQVDNSGAAAFNNQGTLRIPESVTAQITGNYTQSGALRIGAASTATFGRLNVSGNVSLTGAATFVVDVNAVNTLATGQTLDGVITAGGTLTNSAPATNVSDNSALFNFESRTDGTAVDLDVVAAGSPAPAPAPSPSPSPSPSPAPSPSPSPAPSPSPSPAPAPREGIVPAVIDNGLLNGVPTAQVLDGFIRGGRTGTDWDTVVTALGRLPTNAEVALAVGQAMPLMHGNSAQVALAHSAASGSAIEQQAGAVGQSGGNGPVTNGLWVKPVGNWVDQDGRDGASGYGLATYGIVGGLQSDLSARTRLGFGLAYLDSDVDGKGFAAGQRSDIESAQLIGYGRHALGETGWGVSWQGDYTRSRLESVRSLGFIGREAQTRFDGDAWHLGLDISRALALGAGTLTPGVTLDWRRVELDGYTETGAGALSQQADAQIARETLLKVGAQFAQDIDARTQWTGRAAVGYDLASQDPGATVRFTGGGSAFTTDGLPKSRALAELGMGLRWRPAENIEVLARYALRLRKGLNDQSASVRLGWAF